jgi:single-stranded-DNA-specific exonuclease
MDEAARFLRAVGPRVLAVGDRDVDGLTGAELLARTLGARGHTVERWAPPRGTHSHSPETRAHIEARNPDAVIVVDQGSRAGAIAPGRPTLVIDHHQPSGAPDGAVFLSAVNSRPIAPSSLLTYALLLHAFPDERERLGQLGWLALLGTAADLGIDAALEMPIASSLRGDSSRRAFTESIALLNAARRAPVETTTIAQKVLARARSARDIMTGAVDGVAHLREARDAVNAEVQRCARVAPKFYGPVAVLHLSSPAQVHALIATRWVGRLPKHIILAANDAYLPGRVAFSMRAADKSRDLVAFLKALPVGDMGPEYANGHAVATGGHVSREAFDRLLAAFSAVTS